MQVHPVELGGLRLGRDDGICFHLILPSIQLVHAVEHVIPHRHADVVLGRLRDTVHQS